MSPDTAQFVATCIVWLVTVPDWGNVPAWITAVIALLALGVATVGGIAAWRSNQAQQRSLEAAWQANRAQQHTLEMQREQLDMARDQAERAQASKVAFWLPGRDTAERYVKENGKKGTSFTGPNTFRLFNASDGPIFDLTLFDEHGSGRLLYANTRLWPTGTTKPQVCGMLYAKCYPDTASKLHFRDAAGVVWIRDHDGLLAKATEAETATARRVRDESEGSHPGEQPDENPPLDDDRAEGATDES